MSSTCARLPDWVLGALAATVSAGLLVTGYWPLNWHGLAWIALVPWLLVLPRLNPSKAWLLGTLLGLVFYRIGLHWLFALNGPLAGISITVFAVWMGLSFRVARMLMVRFGTAAMLWVVPLAFVGQEVLRCEGLPQLRFPFLALGYSQSGNLWIAQIASLGGVYFLTGLIVAVNAALAYGLLQRRPRAWLPAGVVFGVGLMLAVVSQPPSFDGRLLLPAACIQAETFKSSDYAELAQQAARAVPAPRLMVLPEHALMDYPDEKHRAVKVLAGIAEEHRTCICVGGHVSAPRGAACAYDNVGMLIGPDGRILARQAKCVPLPFFQDGNPASSLAPIATELGTLGVYICYDGLFTDHPRRVVNQGAEVLLVPVMDPDRWPEQERRQHADMAPFRSIELRRCAVRAASAGVSQIIDATGQVIAQRTNADGPGVLAADSYLNDARTVFVRGGHYFATLAGVTFLTAVVMLTLGEWGGWLTRRLRTARADSPR